MSVWVLGYSLFIRCFIHLIPYSWLCSSLNGGSVPAAHAYFFLYVRGATSARFEVCTSCVLTCADVRTCGCAPSPNVYAPLLLHRSITYLCTFLRWVLWNVIVLEPTDDVSAVSAAAQVEFIQLHDIPRCIVCVA